MSGRTPRRALLLVVFCWVAGTCAANAQVFTLPTSSGKFGGDHALRTLSDLTGGAAIVPGSVRNLQGSLADLQQVIRARYLVSYKPASLQHDRRYRAIDIKAEKEGHKLKVYARKGYSSLVAQPGSTVQSVWKYNSGVACRTIE
jgi:hypothetical protein